ASRGVPGKEPAGLLPVDVLLLFFLFLDRLLAAIDLGVGGVGLGHGTGLVLRTLDRVGIGIDGGIGLDLGLLLLRERLVLFLGHGLLAERHRGGDQGRNEGREQKLAGIGHDRSPKKFVKRIWLEAPLPSATGLTLAPLPLPATEQRDLNGRRHGSCDALA